MPPALNQHWHQALEWGEIFLPRLAQATIPRKEPSPHLVVTESSGAGAMAGSPPCSIYMLPSRQDGSNEDATATTSALRQRWYSGWGASIHFCSTSLKHLILAQPVSKPATRGKHSWCIHSCKLLSEHIWGPSLSFWFPSKSLSHLISFFPLYYSIKMYLEMMRCGSSNNLK